MGCLYEGFEGFFSNSQSRRKNCWISSHGLSHALPASGMKSAIQTEGVYLHRAGDMSLPIRFDSIHGVKGETHAATLIVETFARHDLKELLPVLTAVQHGSQMRDLARGHCKRVFVGMSRPSHLLGSGDFRRAR